MNEIIEYLSKNAERIVGNIDQESVDVYLFLKDQFNSSNVSENYLFQFVYRSFYRLDNAGLTSEFKTKYFDIFEQNRNSSKIEIKEIVSTLYKYPNLKKQNSLQFSFATKMVNMISDLTPIYDSEVARIFKFKNPSYSKCFDERLDILVDNLNTLKDSYRNIEESGKLTEILNIFESKKQNISLLSNTKKLDFLIWSAGKIKKTA